jgi:hypothetical protein
MVLQAENSDPATISGYRHKPRPDGMSAAGRKAGIIILRRQVRLQERGDMPFDLRAAVEIMLPLAWQG